MEEQDKLAIDICNKFGLTFIRTYKHHGRKYIEFICPKHKEEIQHRILHSMSKSDIGCLKCKNKYVNKETLLTHPKLDKNVEILGDYITSSTKIKCKCKQCGHNWETTPAHLKRGQGCPQCKVQKISRKLLKSREEFIAEVKKINPHIDIIGEYTGARKKILCQCNKHQITFEVAAGKLIYPHIGCSKCTRFTTESVIGDILHKWGINFEKQKTFEGCQAKGKLFFDYYLPELDVCIEYQGEQHFAPINFGGKSQEWELEIFEEGLYRDFIKRQFCIENKIHLIEVPFWVQDNMEEYLLKYIKRFKP